MRAWNESANGNADRNADADARGEGDAARASPQKFPCVPWCHCPGGRGNPPSSQAVVIICTLVSESVRILVVVFISAFALVPSPSTIVIAIVAVFSPRFVVFILSPLGISPGPSRRFSPVVVT